MTSSGYIPRFKQEMELGANYLLERGLLVTYVGWQREDRTYLQKLSLDQIAQINPAVADVILQGDNDYDLVTLMLATFPGLSEKRAKKAVKDLRKNKEAELPIVRRQVNAPEVKTLAHRS